MFWTQVVECLHVCVHCSVSQPDCRALVGWGLARCRTPLPRAVSQLGTSWYEASQPFQQPFQPPRGELQSVDLFKSWTTAGPTFDRGTLKSGRKEPSVLGEEGSEVEAHGELNLPL